MKKQFPSSYFKDKESALGAHVNDSEFIIYDDNKPKESIVEQNMYQILHDHKDCLKGKCLEARLPVLKQSLYKKDFVPMAFDSVIRGAANNPWEVFKPNGKLAIDSTHRVF